MSTTIQTYLLTMLVLGAVPAAAVDRSEFLMDEAREIEIARTAGPPSVTGEATYYVLRSSGYELVRKGTNGFHCFVERSWSGPNPRNVRSFDPKVKAPHCINPEGARTTLKEMLLVAELAMAGKSVEEIERAVDDGFRDGSLTLPTELSLTYMMSKHQWLGERVGAWHPHVMIWVPYLTEREVGAISAFGTPNAYLAGQPGSRRSVLVIPVPDFLE